MLSRAEPVSSVHRQSVFCRKRSLAFGQLCGRSMASTSSSIDQDMHVHTIRLGCSRVARQGKEKVSKLQLLSSRADRVFKLARPHVTPGGAVNALASDVVQPESSIQPERKTLSADDVALIDASSREREVWCHLMW